MIHAAVKGRLDAIANMSVRKPAMFGKLLSFFSAMALIFQALGIVAAPASNSPPLGQKDFSPAAAKGFGDNQNSWAWSMEWWRSKLYVGTNRAYKCVTIWELHKVAPAFFPYPPQDPDLHCTEDPADLPMQAEIWRWTPETNSWERAYQSPNDVPNPDRAGKLLPRDNGYRSMTVHTDGDGTEALYVAGIGTAAMWEGKVPPPRILRSTDGITFEPIPQDPGTFMGDLLKGSLRSLTSYDGQLFVVHGSVHGSGVILASADPGAGNDAWRQVSPEGVLFFEMHVFDGWLYVGTEDLKNGYSVLKTKATGTPPYDFVTVVPPLGSSLREKMSDAALSMHVMNGRLYVGSGSVSIGNNSEVIRINPDDTWELLVGPPRRTPDGWKYPLSGLGDGFNNDFNLQTYRMEAYEDQLYVGTFDSSTNWKKKNLLQHLLGFDLYRTADGWYFTPITTTGLGEPDDYGARNFADTPYGLFLGTLSDYGLNVWRGIPGSFEAPNPPTRLEVELSDRRPILSWIPAPSAVLYRVFRASLRSVWLFPIPPNSSVRDASGIPLPPDAGRDPSVHVDPQADGLLKEMWFPEEYIQVAVTTSTAFADEPITGEDRYLYAVMAEDESGAVSGPSNLATVPLLTPPITFAALLKSVDRLEQRQRFTSPQATKITRRAILRAFVGASTGDIDKAQFHLEVLRQLVSGGSIVLAPDDTDLEIQISKLIRRLQLANVDLVNPRLLF